MSFEIANLRNKIEKKAIVLFLHDSTGELFVALPMLWYLKKCLDVEVFFVSADKDILQKINVSKRYKEIISAVGTMHFGIKSYLLLTKLYFSKPSIILMSCDQGSRKIDNIFYTILKKSTKVFYIHAYMLHPINNIKTDDVPLRALQESEFENYYGMSPDILINNSIESNYFINRGWSAGSVHAVGSLGYSETWLKFLLKSDLIKKENFSSNKSLKIFIPLRDSHRDYLTEDNYNYLINSLIIIFQKFSSFSFVVKLHPRQSPKKIKKLFSKYNNVIFSDESPFELALKADLTIGFWSSASTDSVAVGTPAIEFHKHEVYHPQLIKKGKKLISILEYLELCEGFEDLNTLEDYIKRLDKEKLRALHEKQYQKLLKIFDLDANYKNNLKNIFEALFLKASAAEIDQKKGKSFYILYKKFINKFLSKK